MKCLAFARRNALEILRDPVNLGFGIGFPVVLLLLLTAIQHNIPVPIFNLERLTPGIAVFGLSFISLFSATLISKDRASAFLSRLLTTPMSSTDFILGYTLPLFPIALGQTFVCYLAALLLGMKFTGAVLTAGIAILPASLVFIGLGLFSGSILNDKQVGGICGALLTNLSAWLSGTWFDLNLVGSGFRKAAYLLPFAHAVDLGRAVIQKDTADILPHLLWVFGWGIFCMALAVLVFQKKVRR